MTHSIEGARCSGAFLDVGGHWIRTIKKTIVVCGGVGRCCARNGEHVSQRAAAPDSCCASPPARRACARGFVRCELCGTVQNKLQRMISLSRQESKKSWRLCLVEPCESRITRPYPETPLKNIVRAPHNPNPRRTLNPTLLIELQSR